MVLVFCGFILGFVALGPVLPISAREPLLVLEEYQHHLLGAVALYLVGVGILSMVKGPTKGPALASGRDQELQTKLDEATRRVGTLEQENGALSQKVREHSEQVTDLQQALAEANKRLSAKPAPLAGGRGIAETIHFVSILQQRGRFIDFIMQDIAPFSNEEVGAVARFVHQGCRAVMAEHFSIEPLVTDEEGSELRYEVEPRGERVRFQGAPTSFPLKGVVLHRGWQTTRAALPVVTVDLQPPYILAPTEVEVS